MKIFILICMMVSSGLSAQYWRAYLGAHWSGGLSYDMEHELPSGEIGAQMALSDFNSISIGVRVFMNIRPETITPTNSFYNIKVQGSQQILPNTFLTAQAGYINAWDGDLMRHYKGAHKSNISYGAGVQYSADDTITMQVIYESLGGYPHLSAGLIFTL